MFSLQRNLSMPAEGVTPDVFWQIVRSPMTKQLIEGYRQTGDAKLKRKLPAFMFQATFDESLSKSGKKGNWRKQSAAKLTGLVVIDVDHIPDPNKLWSEIQNSKFLNESSVTSAERKIEDDSTEVSSSSPSGESERGLGIVLVYITPSGKGLKIVFKARPEWGNLIDNQHRMAELLGVKVDESCKDASRMSFVCREEDILYIHRTELFTYQNPEFAAKYNEAYQKGQSGPTCPSHPNPLPRMGEGENGQGTGENILWRGYDVQSIIDKRFAEKLPCAADSNRHNESLRLASDLLVLFDGDKQRVLEVLCRQPWVKEIIEERNERVDQTVESAAQRMAEREKKYLMQLPSKAMQEAICEVAGKSYQDIVNPTNATSLKVEVEAPLTNLEKQLDTWGREIGELFDDYPTLKDVCKGLKPSQYPAALFVGGGLMMTLMTRCTYRFYHRPEDLRRLNNSTFIIGDPASGKSFATRLYKLLARPIVEADKEGKDAINAYRELMKTKGANKEKPAKPKVVVRIHPARTSNAQFIQDRVNAVEEVDGEKMQLHMLTFDTELDNTLSIQRGGSWIDKQSLELKAFHNEEDGQAYSNVDSILQDFNVTWNFIYTGTPLALKRKVNEQNFGSGLATRLTCIPLPATNFEMMERGRDIDFESDKRLELWARKLDKTKGLLPLDKIVDELYDWTSRRMADAGENDSRADEMLLKRCAYHGLNFATPFIVMRHWQEMEQDGNMWTVHFETDEVDWRLTELLCNIQYACQRHYFGSMAEKYFTAQTQEANANVKRHQKTREAFERLPEEFTTADVMRCFNLRSDGSARTRISFLLRDHQIKKVREEKRNTPALYRKTGVTII